ncbi:hypothetical protein EX30DRAFT_342337 [Ascodesmis nigricans]|uniref:Uncharacterized protein n=1 Tax=Ascodesmis nigricans TaxID=341454 RepID=A0A4S2MST8_9PEZI|nr:hypothetical protein EX30DRAFT_342337 [Ascodesmis nigricans]
MATHILFPYPYPHPNWLMTPAARVAAPQDLTAKLIAVPPPAPQALTAKLVAVPPPVPQQPRQLEAPRVVAVPPPSPALEAGLQIVRLIGGGMLLRGPTGRFLVGGEGGEQARYIVRSGGNQGAFWSNQTMWVDG